MRGAGFLMNCSKARALFSFLVFHSNRITMDDNNNKQKRSRREFLETGITGAAGVALGLVAGNIIQSGQDDMPEMVKMLTPDGKLVEVDKRRLPPMCGKPVAVSNEVLLEWMEKGKP